eukprot:14625800-Ditylum_brightwellii.AAC.1
MNAYNIDSKKCSNIALQYSSYSDGGKKSVEYTEDDNDWINNKTTCPQGKLSLHPLTLDNCTLKMCVPAKAIVEEDISWYSEFMRGVMKEVGMALCEKYHWVLESKMIYLYMDNAGGHGTDETFD